MRPGPYYAHERRHEEASSARQPVREPIITIGHTLIGVCLGLDAGVDFGGAAMNILSFAMPEGLAVADGSILGVLGGIAVYQIVVAAISKLSHTAATPRQLR